MARLEGQGCAGLHDSARSRSDARWPACWKADRPHVTAHPVGANIIGRHIVLDNYPTHKTQAIQRWLAKRPRYHLHFTPTGASWINLVERWFAELTTKQIHRGVHRSTRALEDAIQNYLELNDKDPQPFVWTKTADEILASIARFCERTSNSGH